MKKNKKTRSLGTGLVILGLICLAVTLVLFLNYGSAKPEDFTINDETRQQAIDSAQQAEKQARISISQTLKELLNYYSTAQKNAAAAGQDARAQAFENTAKPFRDLQAVIEAGEALTDQVNNPVQGIKSVDGVEDEVPRISGIQRQARVIMNSQRIIAENTAALGTDQGVAAAGRKAALAGVSTTVWIILLLLSAVIVAAGFVLNHSYGMKSVMGKVCLYTLLVIGAVIMVFPFYWMLSSSIKIRQEVVLFPPQFAPSNWLNFENYRLAFNTAPFARYFLNSIIVCFFSVLIVTVTTILASFAFSRLKFPGRELIFSALLSMMMLPFEMLVITNYSTVIRLGFNDSLPALVFPFISSIFYTYIMRNFFMSIPDSLYWSARVDGCSNWRYLWKVMVPIARPSLVTVVLLNALASWNSFMWPLLVIRTTANRTLPFGLYAFTTEAGAFQELIMAASTIVVLPMIILFLFCRKQILNGVARGGIKG
jgi:multiple sugar transport system permease protein